MKPNLAILGLAFALAAPLSFSQSADRAPSSELSLRSAIDVALEKNLGLRIQTLAPEIAAEAVTAQEAGFDPSVFSRANLSQSDLDWEDSNGATRQTTSDSRSYEVGVTKKVKTGAQITASASQSRSNGSSFNSELGQLVGGSLSERASLSLELTQPLLRDFGRDVNLAPIRRAASQARVADLRTRNTVLDLLQQIETAYWRLSDAYQRRDLRQSNLELSHKLLEEARERENLGLATQLETLQAEANLAQRQEQIIRAEQAIREATDTLFATMGILDETIELSPQLAVSQLPVSQGTLPPFQATLDRAIERNFDSDIQEEVLEQLEQDRILARNNERPQVDLSLSSSYNGLSPESGRDAFSEAFDRRGDDWGLRLSFNLPWGSRAAKSNLRQTLYRIDQEELRLATIKQDLLRSVRSAWRDLEASRQQLSAAELVVALQEATYEQETSKYEEGLSTFRTLLEIQRDLDQAKLALLDAQLASIEAEITLARVEGSLLDRHGIEWNDTLPNSQ
ncbi:TolC family protein [Pelagicoccus sp. SDUM812005]|uniref:TolC family protein n=1 Tax=Pelagicoccus sp. SDUM812005 TaxID=3041257 RepID=UPI00280E862E|nr:TolC family protein [Pelagicoccus sp. SDUM812005]MDQ8179062.1 TolC family protein [Pelagicoccus sp. SDUM812005]